MSTMRDHLTPSVHELRAFAACARLGSASRAGEELNLTQSAISRAIRTLEDRLQVRLFRRVRQRLILSEAGRAMLYDAEDILNRLDNTARMAAAFGSSGEVLRLAVLPTFASAWLIPRLPRFAEVAPHISLDLTAVLDPVDFEASPFDAAVQRVALARPGTMWHRIVDERLVVVGSPDMVGDGIGLAELPSHPLIQQATRPRLWTDWLKSNGLEPEARLRGPRFAHFEMVVAAARSGMGLALLPDIFVAESLATGALKQVFDFSMLGPSPYAVIRPDNREVGGSLSLFLDWVAGEANG